MKTHNIKIINKYKFNFNFTSAKYRLLFCAAVMLFSGIAHASVRLSQVDPSTLLLDQRVRVYVSMTDSSGLPVRGLTSDNFRIFESADPQTFTKEPDILDFKSLVNYESGIQFLLLVDNSGSMYRSMKKEGGPYTTRIGSAKTAIRTFLKNVNNPNDRVGLASYNSYYTLHSSVSPQKSRIYDLLDEIKRPAGNEGYTEIYSSLYSAVDDIRALKGRKVLIVLSDGENRSYYTHTGRPHREHGTRVYRYSEPLDFCQKEGISVFVINYGTNRHGRDRRLQDIALQTGGAVFNAHSSSELAGVYSTIVNQVLHEYLITYRATMIPADRRYVKVAYNRRGKKGNAVRIYFASTVFGLPLKNLSPFLILPFILAFLLAWLLSKIKFEKPPHDALLEVLNAGPAQSVTKVFSLGSSKTVIGGSENADMTIAGGLTTVKEKHATVLYDDKRKNYTLVSEEDVKVNNKKVRTKVLESGDVINVEGTTIVFDDGVVD